MYSCCSPSWSVDKSRGPYLYAETILGSKLWHQPRKGEKLAGHRISVNSETIRHSKKIHGKDGRDGKDPIINSYDWKQIPTWSTIINALYISSIFYTIPSYSIHPTHPDATMIRSVAPLRISPLHCCRIHHATAGCVRSCRHLFHLQTAIAILIVVQEDELHPGQLRWPW